jgi:hypothetical protein
MQVPAVFLCLFSAQGLAHNTHLVITAEKQANAIEEGMILCLNHRAARYLCQLCKSWDLIAKNRCHSYPPEFVSRHYIFFSFLSG